MTQHQTQSQGSCPSPRELSQSGARLVKELADKHGFGETAVTAMLAALDRGGGRQAQFSDPELGGMGQWSRGGMLMIGDMFNDALKARVGALAADAAERAAKGGFFKPDAMAGIDWPAELGTPAATGSQNNMRYAFFPDKRRLAIARGGEIELYDTGDHQIGGFGQQQDSSERLSFTSQHGPVTIDMLHRVGGSMDAQATSGLDRREDRELPRERPTDALGEPKRAGEPDGSRSKGEDAHASILAAIEGIAGLHAKGILSDEEFAAKKAELLGRL
ncbi:SHOCT domain-containing protein [Sphingobium algorifonticola]|uniref:SHOCT domain-containing protein n=1 Tax=Sphingobium algorifonticola TaxID=2008318 RepID=A0A437J2G5_9SPHN|nr:SHOCT domain-containing protein [Sphingobium algorifonticola]RVT38381.1 SHOCT domain-containing protein [Sphingobium algorifonticola]